jgi:hypothetical protein
MKTTHIASIVLAALIAALPAAAIAAGKPVLPSGTPIRVMDTALGAGWHDGKIGLADNGCTMVFLNQKSKAGYTSVSFAGKRQLQMQKNGAWIDVPVAQLNPLQPKECQDGGDND